MMKVGMEINGFQIIQTYDLKKQGVLWEMEHMQTKAQIAWLDNKEENKVFSIAFKTTPEDDSGVFHVLEHAVLNGSKNYPVKNLFVELMKGSLNTYLNAMTFPEKTVFPVASRNEEDFFHLVKVYLDSTLFPMVLTEQHVFEQEHTVVYNEMKGVYSSPEERLSLGLPKIIFPDTYLGKESGGYPAEIGKLTYEKLKEMHAKYYHPTNAYVYMEGDFDMDRMLPLVDSYFSCFEEGESITFEKQEIAGAFSEEEAYESFFEEDKTLYACGRLLKKEYSREEHIALSVLCNYLAGSNESPLKKVILDAGIALDMNIYVASDIPQPYLAIHLLQMDYERKEEAIVLINETLENLIKQGICKEDLYAEIDQAEFFFKDLEEPAGMVRSDMVLRNWINYDNPVAGMNIDEDLTTLRKYVATGHFDELLNELKAENVSEYILYPGEALEGSAEMEPSEELLAWQNESVDEKLLALLPKLKRSDIKETDIFLDTIHKKFKDSHVIFHPAKTNEINHYSLYFSVSDCSIDELQILSLMTNLFGNLPTTKHKLSQLEKEMKGNVGQADYNLKIYPGEAANECRAFFQVSFSVLEKNEEKAFELISEIMQRTIFTSENCKYFIYQIVMQGQDNMFQDIMAEGSRYASLRAASHIQATETLAEKVEGYTFFEYLSELAENFEDSIDELAVKMSALCEKVFCTSRMTISLTAAKLEDRAKNIAELFESSDGEFCKEGSLQSYMTIVPDGSCKKEHIQVPSMVGYAAAAGLLPNQRADYCGAFEVLSNIMDYDYLWSKIRVQGGAYGCGSYISRYGSFGYSSYRDPDADRSLEVFANSYKMKENLPESIEDYIIGAYAANTPLLHIRRLAAMADGDYFGGISKDDRMKTLSEILETTREELISLADKIKPVEGKYASCVISE